MSLFPLNYLGTLPITPKWPQHEVLVLLGPVYLVGRSSSSEAIERYAARGRPREIVIT